MKLNQALNQAEKRLKLLPAKHLDAEVLLICVLQKNRPQINRAWLISHQDESLSDQDQKLYFQLVERRAQFEPIAYILNSKEFYGRNFYIDQRVLIPRPETEILVNNAMEIIGQVSGVRCQVSVLELGTGSGCITISIIKELEQKGISLDKFEFTATDISNDALDVAKQNARDHQVDDKITFLQSDLFQAFRDPQSSILNPKYSFILANLPYVPNYWLTESPSEYGLIHEPKIAIEGGKQGLELIDRFFSQVEKFLVKDGTIILEFGDEQSEELEKLIKKYLPETKISIFNDYQNLPRIALIRTD